MTLTNRKKATLRRVQACLLLILGLMAGGCSKTKLPAVQDSALPVGSAPSPEQLEKVVVEAFRAYPSVIRRDQSATATVSLTGAQAGTVLTLA
ncbi:MAG TPA: hypothetical protein VGJ88_06125, partial [Thermoanaerobaculia bacterium]